MDLRAGDREGQAARDRHMGTETRHSAIIRYAICRHWPPDGDCCSFRRPHTPGDSRLTSSSWRAPSTSCPSRSVRSSRRTGRSSSSARSIPDLWRNAGFTEEPPNHFLDFDAYGPYPFKDLPREYDEALKKHGIDKLRQNGLVPWRTHEIAGRLIRGLRGAAQERAVRAERHPVFLGHHRPLRGRCARAAARGAQLQRAADGADRHPQPVGRRALHPVPEAARRSSPARSSRSRTNAISFSTRCSKALSWQTMCSRPTRRRSAIETSTTTSTLKLFSLRLVLFWRSASTTRSAAWPRSSQAHGNKQGSPHCRRILHRGLRSGAVRTRARRRPILDGRVSHSGRSRPVRALLRARRRLTTTSPAESRRKGGSPSCTPTSATRSRASKRSGSAGRRACTTARARGPSG